MNIKQTLFILLCVISFTACKKEYSVEDIKQVPKLTSNTEVVTVGNIFNRQYIPAYWRDTSFAYVDPLSTDPAFASSVEKWNSNIIIVGVCSSQNRWLPCYWINGKRYILSLDPNYNDYDAIDIKVYNNAVYILGRYTTVGLNIGNSIIWKINAINNTPQLIQLIAPNNSSGNNQYATNMAVANNKLFVFGSYNAQFTSPNETREQPCIWEINALDNVTVTTPESNRNKDFCAFCGDASDKGIYMVGKDYDSQFGRETGSRINDSIYIWTKQERFLTLNRPNTSYYPNFYDGPFKVKINNKGNLYLSYTAYALTSYQPKLSIITPQKQVTESNILTLTDQDTYSFGIDIQNEDYAFGIYQADRIRNRFSAVTEKNDISIPQNSNDVTLGMLLKCTRIFPK